jgi:hypothetical protein
MKQYRKHGFTPSLLVGVLVVICVGQTNARAEDLSGCWVGWIGNDPTYLFFKSNHECEFNQRNNCTVSYPPSGDANYDIRLDYQDDDYNLVLLGKIDGDRMGGLGFSFSRGTSCPLPGRFILRGRSRPATLLRASRTTR